ncbi:helix-turn-helix domain-containing protein [Lacticaseibacillus mingshuiensis]|uniref:Helix-turn-helix domain-containing protein n=1 Tax=Lacticaseibacillus mingshuiensis TaxID=2799574 RepID=A0ABW4CIE5_9LACO|nr:helix-turn-helix transcriptional regulator [Lacticaseibacillus mingshuiensis]
MTAMKIGQQIAALRQGKAVTQQTLADFLGVSKASVSKWEKDQTFPDITLLPLLAAYFGVSIDTLLSYDAQLSAEQIRRIYSQLSKAFQTQPATQVLTSITDLTRRYYSCAPLLFEVGQLILNHFDLLPGKDASEKTQTYVTQARDLFQRCQQLSSDPTVLTKSRAAEAYCDLQLNQPDEVLALLGETATETYPTEALIAWAHQVKGETQAAITTTQAALYQYVTILLSQLTNYAQLIAGKPDQVAATEARGLALIDAFHIADLSPVLLVNFLISCASARAIGGATAEALADLQRYAALLETMTLPLGLHGDAYFDQIDDWLAQTDLGGQLPRNADQLLHELPNVPFTVPPLAALLAQPAQAPLAARFTQLKETFAHA